MIVDSSAIIAMILGEPERDRINQLLSIEAPIRISAGNWIELAAVMTHRPGISLTDLHAVIARYAITIEPVTVDQAQIGHDAYRRYGIGSGHRAQLNFGDCFAYALAKVTGEALLFKGDDFIHTDVIAAI